MPSTMFHDSIYIFIYLYKIIRMVYYHIYTRIYLGLIFTILCKSKLVLFFAKSLPNHEINNQKTLFKAEGIIQSWDRHNVWASGRLFNLILYVDNPGTMLNTYYVIILGIRPHIHSMRQEPTVREHLILFLKFSL